LYFEEFVPKVNAIEAPDVVRAAAKYVDPARMVTLVVGDHQAIGESLVALGLGEPQLLPPEM
jgi:predicted Zn-dependent peptidase